MPAGWIVWCDLIVFGIGTTRDEALQDVRRWIPSWHGAVQAACGRADEGVFFVAPATSRLIDRVRTGRADVRHHCVDPVSGLRDLQSETRS